MVVDLLAPTPPKDKSFDALVKIFKDHSEVKPVVVQAANNSVADSYYVTELLRLTTLCDSV